MYIYVYITNKHIFVI